MKKIIVTVAAVFLCALCIFAQNKVSINLSEEKGAIRPLNGVGGGARNFVTASLMKAARIPYSRLHDIGHSLEFSVELMNIFPDFDAPENKESSYDFVVTDEYIKGLLKSGAKIIWRLSNNGNEGACVRKEGSWPPKDYKKWARICEHVIRHYNEGWADGYHFGIEHWEIWWEPDLDQKILTSNENLVPSDLDKIGKEPRYKVSPHAWGGTMQEYYDFYSTAFKHLKRRFPKLKFGGPANAGFEWNEPFIQAMQKKGVKVDFFSWHCYSRTPALVAEQASKVRALLDSYGWNDVPSFLDEWNYQSSWDAAGSAYSAAVRRDIKGAAFAAAVLSSVQNTACVDVANYYDWRHNTSYNGAFDRETGNELAGYYSLYNWGKLLEYGTSVAVELPQWGDLYATAAKNSEGKVRLLLTRYNDDDSVFGNKTLTIALPEGCTKAVCMLSDSYHVNTNYPVKVSNGSVKLSLEPNSFVIVNFE